MERNQYEVTCCGYRFRIYNEEGRYVGGARTLDKAEILVHLMELDDRRNPFLQEKGRMPRYEIRERWVKR